MARDAVTRATHPLGINWSLDIGHSLVAP